MIAIRFASIAKRDLTQIASWYADAQIGLGRRFEADLDLTLRRIQNGPQIYPKIEEEIHRAPLRKFP